MRQGNGLAGKLRLQAPRACAVVSQDFTNKYKGEDKIIKNFKTEY